ASRRNPLLPADRTRRTNRLTGETASLSSVMPGLDPGIHFLCRNLLTKMDGLPGISAFTRVFDALCPAMTELDLLAAADITCRPLATLLSLGPALDNGDCHVPARTFSRRGCCADARADAHQAVCSAHLVRFKRPLRHAPADRAQGRRSV